MLSRMGRALLLLSAIVALGACSAVPEAPKRQPLRQSTAVYTPSPDARQCLSSLGLTKAAFTPLPDRYFDQGCQAVNTVRLAALSSDNGALELSNVGRVTCPMATTFAGWARFGLDRAARQILGSPLVRIETMGSYACRNVAGTGRRSAHSTANAIDVSGFVLADGRRVSVQHAWHGGSEAERQFLRVIHASACKRFGTVLGPDYNAAHYDHLHVEIGSDARAFCR
jgi:hypothetical protein